MSKPITYEYNIARDTNASKSAKLRLQSQFLIGKQRQDELIALVSNMIITDALVYPRAMLMSWDKGLLISLHPNKPLLKLHPHALTQMSTVVEYPLVYVRKLTNGCAGISKSKCTAKLVQDMNWHLSECELKDRRSQPARYLCRYVDDELRGFLSRSFKRHLASKPLLRSFVSSCGQLGLQPVDAQASAVRFNLQMVLPYVFEPVDGEFICVGVSWTNSDFGGGRLKVSTFMRRTNGTSAILDDAISEVHIGPIIEEADIELSDETINAELEAQKSAIRDAVIGQLQPDKVHKLLGVIKAAQEEEIPWERLKGELNHLLQKKELETVGELLAKGRTDGFEELPAIKFNDEGDPVPTRWWATSVIGSIAEKESDAERKKELQEFAGTLLGKTKTPKANKAA